ncbi:MAG TPA: hypothetical protein VHY91_12030 [Pirellulales bacterium]|nr:hypothetical protein [Pirellulales bacterium]
MRTHQTLALVLLVVLSAAGCGKSRAVLAADKIAEPPSLNARLRQLLVRRVETARKTREAVDAAFQADTVAFGDLVTATNDLWNAELAAANTPEERIAAHRRRVINFRQMEQKIEALHKVGVRGGEAIKYGIARYNRESAVIGLMESCMATGLPYPKFDDDVDLPSHPNPFEP